MSRSGGSTRRGAAAGLAALVVVLPITATPLAPAAPAGAAPVRTATLATPAVGTPGSGTPGLAVASTATRTLVPTTTANTRISTVLRSRTTSKVLGRRFTMSVWDTATGSYVFSRRASASVRGASTTKVLTAVGVLATLGPEHQFPTTVRAGSVPGEVVLVAGGDPLLTSADLRALAASTASALGATSAPTPPAPPADPATAAPAPSTPAITVRADDSLFADQGQRARGWRTSYVPQQVRHVGAFARDDRRVRDATADAGTFFAAELRALGLSAEYAGEAVATPESATLAAFPGHSVADAVSRALLVSDNDTAEMLFRHVAAARGLPTTWAGARQALADTLTELAIPLDGVRIVDGSGLSLEGRLTARALTSALNRALSPDHPRLAGLRGWLPVAGQTGTLKAVYKRFASKPSSCAVGLIQAKTGTVADAVALAGYAQGADGQTKIFVSIVNSRPTRYSRLTTRKHVDRAASSVTGCW